jgi:hypothetical protein
MQPRWESPGGVGFFYGQLKLRLGSLRNSGASRLGSLRERLCDFRSCVAAKLRLGSLRERLGDFRRGGVALQRLCCAVVIRGGTCFRKWK